jgi:hypothetical protein
MIVSETQGTYMGQYGMPVRAPSQTRYVREVGAYSIGARQWVLLRTRPVVLCQMQTRDRPADANLLAY